MYVCMYVFIALFNLKYSHGVQIEQKDNTPNPIKQRNSGHKTFTCLLYLPRSFATQTTPPWSLMQRTCRHQSFPTLPTTLTLTGILDSLRNDNGDGYENVT